MKNLLIYFVFFLLLLSALSNAASFITPDKNYHKLSWSGTEQSKAIAVKNISRLSFSSTHIIRLSDREKPHYHDRHDLMVVVLKGKAIIHFKEHRVILSEGDAVSIPRGTFHWAENMASPQASEVIAVFSPPFDGKDRRPAE